MARVVQHLNCAQTRSDVNIHTEVHQLSTLKNIKFIRHAQEIQHKSLLSLAGKSRKTHFDDVMSPQQCEEEIQLLFLSVFRRSRMRICGHQFQGNDGSDWVLSTSVGFLYESTTASRILQELFKKRCRSFPTEAPRKCPKTVIASSTKPPAPAEKKTQPEETLVVRKIPGISILENFDESQHLNGCPIKWLYNKRLLEKKKRFRVQMLCCKQPPRKEEVRREKGSNLRDRTPVEMKIHKINLIEKYTTDSDDVYPKKQEPELEARRKQLAAKLNWKLHDESQEDPHEVLSDAGPRHNYFPPRPLLGLKPLLSVLLAPHKTNCCCLVTQLRGNTPTVKKGATLSIRSLDLPLPPPETNPRPSLRTPNALRRGSKSSTNPKKLQIPNQVVMKLDQKKQNNEKVIHHNPLTKKTSEHRKQTKSLSCLFYELRGKTSHQNEEAFEEMIQDLKPEGQFKVKRFLNLENWGEGRGGAPRRKGKSAETDSGGGGKDFNLMCGKIHFFEKVCPKGMKPRQGLKSTYNPNFSPPSSIAVNS